MAKDKSMAVDSMYTAEKRKQMERILQRFSDYIRRSPHIALAYSEKMGYVYFDLGSDGSIVSEPTVLAEPEQLCRMLLREIAYDVLEENPRTDLDIFGAPDEKKAAIRERMKAYLLPFPEYQHLIESIFQ